MSIILLSEIGIIGEIRNFGSDKKKNEEK